MNICHVVFEKHLIYHTYATRPNKGTHKAVDFAQKNILKQQWYAKLDIRKYFDNINHNILQAGLARIFKDKYLLDIFNDNYTIDHFSFVNDKGELFEDVELLPDKINRNFDCNFGCGIFELTKK